MTGIPPLGIELSKEVLQGVSQFAQRLFGPTVEAADFFSDQIRFHRYKSGVKILQKAKKICEDNNIDVKALPIKFLVPFLEKSSLEEDTSELIDLWAALLANASDKCNGAMLTYSDILSKISRNEAVILERMFSKIRPGSMGISSVYQPKEPGEYVDEFFDGEKIVIKLDEYGVDKKGRFFDLLAITTVEEKNIVDIKFGNKTEGYRENIDILGVLACHNVVVFDSIFQKMEIIEHKPYNYSAMWGGELTYLGYNFVSACTVKKANVL